MVWSLPILPYRYFQTASETLAGKISDRRRTTRITRGRREHIWIVYCCPDLRHYDHTYLVIDGLVQDEKFRISPAKLVPSDADTPYLKSWLEGSQWAKLIATTNFLDMRLINFPTIAAVTAALTYSDPSVLQSFKDTPLADYQDLIPEEMKIGTVDWDQRLAERRLQVMNARDSLEGTNLFRLLKGLPAEQQKGGNSESTPAVGRYFHLRNTVSEALIHYYIGCGLKDLLEYTQFPGLIGVETEQPLIRGQSSPIPDITIHTETDIYALEFHFLSKQAASSQISTYALKNVISKYMRDMPQLSNILKTIES